MIPKPFSRVTVAYSDPMFVESPDSRSAAEQAPRFEAMMRDVEAEAEQAGTAA
jgi:lysophospholipid acyltransferase (LPLAT)-like uncharacterized protein